MTKDEALSEIVRVADYLKTALDKGEPIHESRWLDGLMEAQAALSEPDWTRIEDMPEEWKDGRSLLKYPHPGIVHWNGHGWAVEYVGDGYEDDNDKHAWRYCHPTHVMLPPPPPKGETL